MAENYNFGSVIENCDFAAIPALLKYLTMQMDHG